MKNEIKSQMKGALKAIAAIAVLGIMIGVGYATTVITDEGIWVNGSAVMVEGDCIAWVHDGSVVFSDAAPTLWTELDLSAYVGAKHAFVILRVAATTSDSCIHVRPHGDTCNYYSDSLDSFFSADLPNGCCALVGCETDSNGKVDWYDHYEIGGQHTITLLGYIAE